MGIEKIANSNLASDVEQKHAERSVNMDRVFDYLNLEEKEKLLFITDDNPYYTDREFIDFMKAKLLSRGIEFSEIMADDKKTKQKELIKGLAGYDIVFNTWGMEKSRVNFDKLAEAVTNKGGRMAYCPGLKAEYLDNEGVLAENKEELDYRLAKMEAKLKNVAGFHITSAYGTDLKIKMMPGERKWVKDNGELNPGKYGSLPGGDIYTVPDEENINGVIVLPVLSEEVAKDQGVDKYIRLEIRNGKIAKIDGGKSAEMLREYFLENSKDEQDLKSVLQISDIGFGANSKAQALVFNESGEYNDPRNPTIDATKRLGTMHFGVGSSQFGEDGAEGHTESEIHLDFVLPRNGLTVKAFYSREDFKKGKNGERLIDEGRWRLAE